jgi:FMN reductase
MSVMPFANSLMLDYRCRIIPRYVYTTSESFSEGQLADNEIIDRINELVDTIISWSSS